MAQTMDMTEGKPLKHIISFAIPLMIGYIFQQLYNMVDSAVVGRLIGVEAFAAVGAAGFLSWMVISIILGLTQGFGALFAQLFGARNLLALRKSIAMSIWLSAGVGAVLTALSLLFARPILTAINTPPDILEDTLSYLYWLLAGTYITLFFNLSAAVLRALGNSKAPFYGLVISCVVNIALDFLFVGIFHMGVPGVAIATVIAQLCSCIFCLWKLRGIALVRLTRTDFAMDAQSLKKLVRLGSPLAFRNAVIACGGLVVQYVINGYGTLFVAGVAAPRKYFGIIEIIGGSLDGAVATFVGQNYGASKLGRIREGMRSARRLAVVSACFVGVFLALAGRFLIGLLVSGAPEQIAQVIDIGYQNMLAMAVCVPALYLLFIYRSALQGMGNSLIPMLSGFAELLLRLFSVLVLPLAIAEWGVFLADGIGWIGAAILLMAAYSIVFRKRMETQGINADQV